MSFELHSAAKAGNLKLVEALIKNGANINLIDDDGNTPLHKAIQGCSLEIEGCIEIVKRLVAEKAINLELLNAHGETPLLSASFKGVTAAVKILLENKANVNVIFNVAHLRFPITPLVWACYLGYTEIAKLLIEYGADINVISMEGKTPIVLACSRGLTEVVELLLEQGANIQETLLQDMHDSMKSISFPNKDNCLIEMTELIIPALLLKYPTLTKPSYILENSELSSVWDKQSKKINAFLQNESLASKESRRNILNKIFLEKNTTLRSLAFNFFEPSDIAPNDAEAEKPVSTAAKVSRK